MRPCWLPRQGIALDDGAAMDDLAVPQIHARVGHFAVLLFEYAADRARGEVFDLPAHGPRLGIVPLGGSAHGADLNTNLFQQPIREAPAVEHADRAFPLAPGAGFRGPVQHLAFIPNIRIAGVYPAIPVFRRAQLTDGPENVGPSQAMLRKPDDDLRLE